MSEINVNLNTLREKIEDLRAMQTSWAESIFEVDEVSSGGGAAGQLEVLSATYGSLYKALDQLLDGSIRFFNNIETSYAENDQHAADQINQ